MVVEVDWVEVERCSSKLKGWRLRGCSLRLRGYSLGLRVKVEGRRWRLTGCSLRLWGGG